MMKILGLQISEIGAAYALHLRKEGRMYIEKKK